jgi:uncharacterized protein YuzE
LRITVDQEADILYVKLLDGAPVEESEEVEPGVVVDYDAGGAPVGVEIWDISQRVPPSRPLVEALERIAGLPASAAPATDIARRALSAVESAARSR